MYPEITFPINKNIQNLSSFEVKVLFDWFNSHIDNRIQILEETVSKTSGFGLWKADFSVKSLVELDKWFFENVAYKDGTANMPEGLEGEYNWLRGYIEENNLLGTKSFTNETYSQCFDIGIYFSTMLKTENSSLFWTKFTSKSYVDKNYPVLVNQSKSVRLESNRIMRGIANKYIESNEEGGLILEIYNIWKDLFLK